MRATKLSPRPIAGMSRNDSSY